MIICRQGFTGSTGREHSLWECLTILQKRFKAVSEAVALIWQFLHKFYGKWTPFVKKEVHFL